MINQFHNFVRIFRENIKLIIMNKLVYRILTWGVLPLIIGLLVYANFHSISEPLEFNDEKARRQKVAVQRLKDIRELQDAFSTVYGRYAPTMDSLIWFYNEGKMQITRRIGSPDDSAAVANTQAVIKREKLTRLKGDKLAKALNEYYEKTGDAQLVFETKTNIFIKDTLFHTRKDFNIDSLRYIPFSGGDTVLMRATLTEDKGYKRPLFEACMPFKSLLKGLDNQLRINLDAEQEDKGRYKGLKVGDADSPNGNAGNWEE